MSATPIFDSVVRDMARAEARHIVRANLRVIPGEATDVARVPYCRPTERRLQILNGGFGIHGAVSWNV